jgi:hypothetical protein
MIAESVILKTDGRGRVRTPLAQREALLDAFERSGLSGMKFAALHGVKYPSFANWVQQRKRHRLMAGPGSGPGEVIGSTAASPGASVQWWEGVVDPGAARTDRTGAAAPDCGLQLHLPGGVRMEITGPDQVGWAAQLLQSLAPGARSGTQNLQPLRSC